MLPETYTKLMADLNEHFSLQEKQIADDYKKRIDSITASRKRNQDSITKYVAHFLETGVFVLDSGWDWYTKPFRGNGEHYTTTLNKLGEQLARELKRPLVRLYGQVLRVPKQKQLAVITAPLKFVAEQQDGNRHSWFQSNHDGVIYRPNVYESFDSYVFYGDEGIKHRETFFNYIREPECRKALRIPSL